MLNNSLDYLNSDTSSLVCSHLNVNGLIALNSTSKRWKKSSDAMLEILKPQIFEDLFGAVASHEFGTSYDILATRIHFTMKLSSDIVKKNLLNGKFQVTFEDRIPYLKPVSNHSQDARSYAEINNVCLGEIFAEHIKILESLSTTPICKKRPLHDYRNRLIRHKTILLERDSLLKALQRSEKKERTLWEFLGVMIEKIYRLIINIFSFICGIPISTKPAEITYSLSNYRDPAIPYPNGIEVGAGKITFQGSKKEYKILANPAIVIGERLAKEFLRSNTSRQIDHGARPEQVNISFNFLNDLRPLVHFISNNVYNKKENKPYLYIKMHYGTDANPIISTILQIAMEIFSKSPLKHLRVSTISDPYAYLLAGFQPEFDLPLGLDEVRNFYIQNGILPDYPRQMYFFTISKHNNPLNASKTRFFCSKNGVTQPSYVMLDCANPPTTWEALFNKKSYLNPECESVMWKFYEQNPAKY